MTEITLQIFENKVRDLADKLEEIEILNRQLAEALAEHKEEIPTDVYADLRISFRIIQRIDTDDIIGDLRRDARVLEVQRIDKSLDKKKVMVFNVDSENIIDTFILGMTPEQWASLGTSEAENISGEGYDILFRVVTARMKENGFTCEWDYEVGRIYASDFPDIDVIRVGSDS